MITKALKILKMANPRDRPRRRVDMQRRVSESGEEICAVCSDIIKYFAFGECDHPICYKCSTRMRVLCEQLYCAICRADLPKIAFTRKGDKKFAELDLKNFKLHHKNNIFFENDLIKSAFFELQEHRCTRCDDLKPFRTFFALKEHMRKEHQLFCCDLCIKHIKIFSKERKFYDRKTLGEHRRVGDKDDRSHKGHPLCKFCDERYLDNDELLKHLRKHHYYCHFCEADGITNEYFDVYLNLRDHFRDSHYLCEEDECLHMEFTNAFRDEIDLKAHQAVAHRKNLKKAMSKAARTLDIDFNYAPRNQRRQQGVTGRADYEDVGRGDRGYGRGRGASRRDRERQREEEDFQHAMTASLNQATSSSVSVVDRTLLQPPGLANSQEEPPLDKRPKRRNDQGDTRGRGKASGDRPRPDQQRRMFEESQRNQHELASHSGAPVRGMRDDDSDSDSDSGDYRAQLAVKEPEKKEETEKKEEPQVAEAAQSHSLADKVKLANNFSVQSGGMANDDFPTLGGNKPQNPVDDFPALGNGSSSPRPPSFQAKSKAKPNAVKPKKPVEDFPTLGGGTRPAKAQPQSTGTSWVKSAAPVVNKPTTNMKTGATKTFSLSSASRSVNRPASSMNSDMGDRSSDSLSSISGALLKGKVTGGASEILANYASSTPAPQPAASNVKLVKEKPQTVNMGIQNSIPARTIRDSPGDFPALESSSNTNQAMAAPKWGPKGKPASQTKQQQQNNADNGILTMKTKKSRKTPAPAPVLDSDSESSKHKEPPVKEAVYKLSRDKDDIDEFKPIKVKSKKGQQQSTSVVETSQGASKSNTDNAQKDNKKSSTAADPVQAFLKHLQESEQKEVNDCGNEYISTSQSENKKAKKKKKKKGKSSPNDNEEDQLVRGPLKSEENLPLSSAINKESSISSSKTASSATADYSESSAKPYEPKIGLISAKPASTRDFPSVHDTPTRGKGRKVDLKNDFPELGGGVNKSKAPPPGFLSNKAPSEPPKKSKAPPGFNSNAAPPGFNQKSTPLGLSGIASEILPQTTVDTRANDVHPNNTFDLYQYAKPQAFDVRNRKLITDIQICVSEFSFADFKRYSGEFRRNSLDALSYYNQCSRTLGKNNFNKIFPELLVLLPDINKQRELLTAHKQSSKSTSGGKPWERDEQFNVCPVCEQVLLSLDANDHMDTHVATPDFPALGSLR